MPDLRPWELGRLCPADLRVMLEAARDREKAVWWREAWGLSHLLNVAGKVTKQKTSPGKLLGWVLKR